MVDEGTLFVEVRVDQPGGDAFGSVGMDLGGIGMEDVEPANSRFANRGSGGRERGRRGL